MKNSLILTIVLALFIPACAFLQPDDNRNWKPPTQHFEPYQSPIQNNVHFELVIVSGDTVKNNP